MRERLKMVKIKVVIADDHQLVREGLKTVLENEKDIEVVGSASTGKEVLEYSSKLNPDVVILDLRMPEMDGVEACQRLSIENPDIKIIILTCFDADDDIFSALNAGANSYLLKDIAPIDLINAIRSVTRGQSSLHPNVAKKVIRPRRTQKAINDDYPIEPLTDREKEVLEFMAKGYKNKEIAEKLWVAENTVKTHVRHILQKLNKSDRASVVLYAIRRGIIDLPIE